jgi:Flp pilus assembly protein TadB
VSSGKNRARVQARADARAARETAAAQRLTAELTRREQAAAERARRERRALVWRRLRLWQRTGSSTHRKEKIAALATIALVAVVLTFLLTSSLTAVLFTVLVLVVAMPALAMLTFGARRR